MEIHQNILLEFISGLLGKRKRRFSILYKWNVRQPVKGDSISNIIKHMFSTLLYQPIDFIMTHEGIKFWPNHPDLIIPYNWMTSHERQVIKYIFSKRETVFNSKRFSENNQFELTGCKLKPPKDGWLNSVYRRELIRDFIILCQMQKPNRLKELKYGIMKSIQQFIIEPVNGKVDPFLMSLNRWLNNHCGVDMILTYNQN
jgi:hypothetical protein